MRLSICDTTKGKDSSYHVAQDSYRKAPSQEKGTSGLERETENPAYTHDLRLKPDVFWILFFPLYKMKYTSVFIFKRIFCTIKLCVY